MEDRTEGARVETRGSRFAPVGSRGLWKTLVLAAVLATAPAFAGEGPGQSGSSKVRSDLARFLLGEAIDESEVSLDIPSLGVFDFDRTQAPGVLRTQLSTRSDPPYRGRTAVTVQLFAGERLIKRAIVSPYVRVDVPVVVAVRDLRRGEVLTDSDLRLADRDAGRLPRGVVEDLSRLVGLRMKRRVREGQVILENAAEPVPIVERGDRVVMVLRSGALQLQAMGQARETGGAGEWIRVLNLDSKREISGRLDREGRVHVAF